MLVLMSLIGTPVAPAEWHSGGSVAQMDTGHADSDALTNSHSALEQVLFPTKTFRVKAWSWTAYILQAAQCLT